MAVDEKNIQIKDLAGNLLFPKTKGAVVINNAGENLGGVEAGAQVNIIETVKVNGVALVPDAQRSPMDTQFCLI